MLAAFALPEAWLSFWWALFTPAPLEPIEFPPPPVGPEPPAWTSTPSDFAVFQTPSWPPPFPPEPIAESCWSGCCGSLVASHRIVPSFENGRANGFKVLGIRPNSLYHKVGLRSGDVVVRINGFPITSPDQAWAAYDKLRGAKTLRLEIRRRGRPRHLTFRIPR